MGGDWPSEAIRRLLEQFGEEHFGGECVITVDDHSRDSHLEFLLPLKGRTKIPVPSVN